MQKRGEKWGLKVDCWREIFFGFLFHQTNSILICEEKPNFNKLYSNNSKLFCPQKTFNPKRCCQKKNQNQKEAVIMKITPKQTRRSLISIISKSFWEYPISNQRHEIKMNQRNVGSQLAKRTDAVTLKYEGKWYNKRNHWSLPSNSYQGRLMDLAKVIKSMKNVRKMDISSPSYW